MLKHSRLWGVALAALVATAACGSERKGTERWTTTENTNVKIDWDKVNDAYKKADGPADLERRVNEIYEGDEIISVSVQDVDDKTQVVTGFFDKNTDGKVDDPEKIFTITRTITGPSEAQYQTAGHGYYGGYMSPMLSIASGMLMGSMMASMFMPSYVPMYSQPYVTNSARHGELRSQRSSYRAANPERFAKTSRTGRSYGGSSGTRSSAPRSRGGSRFGVRAQSGRLRERLAA
ncbi:MAG: hypothetical protein KBG48_24540 [Kofleriaceae bacterium]|jgi:hypothetical protein|nr:hypothetical protein [Kofleriaceae bacterium]MBP9170594.1 hypothetical protein [Kofleriaceae bacterium]MBP9863430.1 hypothetical protein [Kofleriaceae bacterium]